jgi:uncharacterized cupredoxin-like copper-binding protein
MHRPSTARLASLVAVLAVVAVSAGSALAAPTRASVTAVKVTASEFKFVLSTKTVHAGAVKFTLLNRGKLPHDFKIAGKKTAQIGPGKSATLMVTLKAGRYPYSCTVPGHAAAGMKGVLVAK